MTAIQIADSFDSFAIDHTPDGWPAVQQKQLTEAAAELRRLEAQLQKETAARQAAQIEAEALKERLVRADAEKCAAVLAERIAPKAPMQEPEKLNPLTQLQVAYVMGLRAAQPRKAVKLTHQFQITECHPVLYGLRDAQPRKAVKLSDSEILAALEVEYVSSAQNRHLFLSDARTIEAAVWAKLGVEK